MDSSPREIAPRGYFNNYTLPILLRFLQYLPSLFIYIILHSPLHPTLPFLLSKLQYPSFSSPSFVLQYPFFSSPTFIITLIFLLSNGERRKGSKGSRKEGRIVYDKKTKNEWPFLVQILLMLDQILLFLDQILLLF